LKGDCDDAENTLRCIAEGYIACNVFFSSDVTYSSANSYGLRIRCTKNTLHKRCIESDNSNALLLNLVELTFASKTPSTSPFLSLD